MSNGLMVKLGYTGVYQRDKIYYMNECHAQPFWSLSNSSRPNRFTAVAIYQLPFGKGKAFAKSGLLNNLLDGFQASATYEYQPGPLAASTIQNAAAMLSSTSRIPDHEF